MKACEHDSLIRQGIQAGCLYFTTEGAHIRVAQIVGDNEQNVGTIRCCSDTY
jgi:hypothetical protein